VKWILLEACAPKANAPESDFPARPEVMARILVVEDDAETAALIVGALVAEGHDVDHLADGRVALDRLGVERFDAMTVDRMLPGIDGLTLVARMRARSITTPVLVISALGDVDERIAGCARGRRLSGLAPAEMAMRVEVLLRRNREYPGWFLRAGPVEIDLVKRRVGGWRAGRTAQRVSPAGISDAPCRACGQPPGDFRTGVGPLFRTERQSHQRPYRQIAQEAGAPGQGDLIQTVKGEGYRLVMA
jgi:two-component system OmpR family response regulator